RQPRARAFIAAVSLAFAMVTAPAGSAAAAMGLLVGDCDGSGVVTVDELMTLVNIAFGAAPLTLCPAGDADGSSGITIDAIITAVNKALNPRPASVCDGFVIPPRADTSACDDVSADHPETLGRCLRGSGHLGEWSVDAAGLPAYDFTVEERCDPAAHA